MGDNIANNKPARGAILPLTLMLELSVEMREHETVRLQREGEGLRLSLTMGGVLPLLPPCSRVIITSFLVKEFGGRWFSFEELIRDSALRSPPPQFPHHMSSLFLLLFDPRPL